MQREKNSETFMTKLARFIVDKRKAFYLIFIAAYYNKFGQESRAASPAFFPSRA